MCQVAQKKSGVSKVHPSNEVHICSNAQLNSSFAATLDTNYFQLANPSPSLELAL